MVEKYKFSCDAFSGAIYLDGSIIMCRFTNIRWHKFKNFQFNGASYEFHSAEFWSLGLYGVTLNRNYDSGIFTTGYYRKWMAEESFNNFKKYFKKYKKRLESGVPSRNTIMED
jgi:hypothetical protein